VLQRFTFFPAHNQRSNRFNQFKWCVITAMHAGYKLPPTDTQQVGCDELGIRPRRGHTRFF
jgi:hypothetical protein